MKYDADILMVAVIIEEIDQLHEPAPCVPFTLSHRAVCFVLLDWLHVARAAECAHGDQISSINMACELFGLA